MYVDVIILFCHSISEVFRQSKTLQYNIAIIYIYIWCQFKFDYDFCQMAVSFGITVLPAASHNTRL